MPVESVQGRERRHDLGAQADPGLARCVWCPGVVHSPLLQTNSLSEVLWRMRNGLILDCNDNNPMKPEAGCCCRCSISSSFVLHKRIEFAATCSPLLFPRPAPVQHFNMSMVSTGRHGRESRESTRLRPLTVNGSMADRVDQRAIESILVATLRASPPPRVPNHTTVCPKGN